MTDADDQVTVSRREVRKAVHEQFYPLLTLGTPAERQRVLRAGDRLFAALGGHVESDGAELGK